MSELTASHPERVGPYLIDTEIGRGAHGVVYRAHHEARPEQAVALKVVENRGQLDKLLVEPEILSKLRHPGIVGLDDYFLAGDRLVVALEFIRGQDLKAYLDRRGTLPPAEVREFLRQMAAAIQHAHAAGVLHRDIKPSNILVHEREGQPPRFVLTDFGISRLANGLQVTRHGGGTYLYMAPEQLRGRPEKQSDLWSLGVVAYVLLTGRQPFVGATLAELSHEVFYTIPRPPRDLQPTAADDSLERLLYGLLEKQVTARTASAEELLSQLQESASSSAAAPAALAQAGPEQDLTHDLHLKANIRRHWVWFWCAATLLAGPYGLFPQMLMLAGALRFQQGQSGRGPARGRSYSVSGLFLMALGTVASLLMPGWIGAALRSLGWNAGTIATFQTAAVLVALACGLSLPFLAIYHFAEARRRQRELNLRQAITASTSQPAAYVQLLRGFLEQSPEDIRLQQRYVEALLAHGQAQEAAVEARLLLEQDPYDFGGSLLLAQSYLDLGLHRPCIAVCEAFLDVTGYCFEFEELKTRCQAAVV